MKNAIAYLIEASVSKKKRFITLAPVINVIKHFIVITDAHCKIGRFFGTVQ
jgi:hypothetical protein